MVEVTAHRIQFYDYKPSPFTCLARSTYGLHAAGRKDGSIDIYDENRNFFMVAHINKKVCGSVQALIWLGSRLFCTGALGKVIELDLCTMSMKGFALLVGCPVARCIAASKERVIVGSDEGFVTVFSTDSSNPVPELTLQKFSGKIMSLTCDSTNNELLALGTSLGCLFVISLLDNTYKTQFKLTEAGHTCVIWTVLFSRGFLFSGDSRGVVNIWDVSVGGLLFSFSCHRADVLTLATNPDGSIVFSGGVDAVVRRFEYCKSDIGEGQWQLSGIIHGCRRDIHGLAYIPGHHYDPGFDIANSDLRFEPHRLLAVGEDARLQILACEMPENGVQGLALAPYNLACQVGKPSAKADKDITHVAALPFWPIGFAPTRPPPITFVTMPESQIPPAPRPIENVRSRHICLLHYSNKLCLVGLGCPCVSKGFREENGVKLVPMSLGPYQLAEIRPIKETELIVSTLSQCGKFIAYSDLQRTRLLKLEIRGETNSDAFTNPRIEINPLEWQQTRTNLMSSTSSNDPTSPHIVKGNTRKRSRSENSSSQSETDTTDTEDNGSENLLVAKLFSLNDNIIHTDSVIHDDPVSSDQCDFVQFASADKVTNASVMPPAHCLIFTPNSENLLLISQKDGHLLCLSVASGHLLWRCVPGGDETISIRGSSIALSRFETVVGYIIAVGCSDGRVRLYSSNAGELIFTCPCLESEIGHVPFPVMVTFSPNQMQSSKTDASVKDTVDDADRNVMQSVVYFSILYTNNQFREWTLKLNYPTDDSKLDVSAKSNKWLVKFWKTMHDEVSHTLGLFHSLQYMESNKWLLASAHYIMILSTDGTYEPGILHDMVKKKSVIREDSCIKINKHFQVILQTSVLKPDEIAVVCIYSPNIALNLASPMQKKYFGT